MIQGNKRSRDKQEDYEELVDKTPKSFVFKMGKVGVSVTHLIEDLREVMEPHTARNLKVKSSNSMKDFLSVR